MEWDWHVLKKLVNKTLLNEARNLHTLGWSIWRRPELNYQEHFAHKLLTSFLEMHEFEVERSYVVSTAFRAEYWNPSLNGDEVPTVCIMCEYDALPSIGHGCGHNLIAEAGVAAGVAVKAVLKLIPEVAGRVVVMGTPAEEGGGGKIRLINAGALKDIHFAMMVHPTSVDAIYLGSQATAGVYVNYFSDDNSNLYGDTETIPSASSSPMDAAVVCYNNISRFRQQMKPTWRIQSIITKGGHDLNVLPTQTSLLVNYRALTKKEMLWLQEPLAQCFDGAALSTGCKVQYNFRPESGYQSLLLNEPMLMTYEQFATEAGVKFASHGFRNRAGGSTDMGNVSRVIPSIHPRYAIPTLGSNHTKAFTSAAGSKSAQLPTLRAAQCMALTTLKLFIDRDLRRNVKKEFATCSARD